MKKLLAGLLMALAAAAGLAQSTNRTSLVNRVDPGPGAAVGDVYYTCKPGSLFQVCLLPKSTNGFVLTLAGGVPTWAAGGGGSSPLTTKGDVYGHSTVDARIPVGTNGQAFIADSAQTLGLKWGTLGFAGGGTGATSFTAGSVIFSNGTTLAQDNSNFFYDSTNHWLGLGIGLSATPTTPLTVIDSRSGTSFGQGWFQNTVGNAAVNIMAPTTQQATLGLISQRHWNLEAMEVGDPLPGGFRICDYSSDSTCDGVGRRLSLDSSGNTFISPGALTVGSNATTSLRSNANLWVTGGGVAIGGVAGASASASIDVGTIYGGGGLLTKLVGTGSSLDGLNNVASTNGGGTAQWWSWGPTSGNVYRILQGTSFSGNGGLNIDSSGHVSAGIVPAIYNLSTDVFGLFGSTSGSVGQKAPATGGDGTVYQWPAAHPTSTGQALTATTGGVMTWSGSSLLTSPLTTKGDLWGFDTGNDRVPIGADTFVLTADSTQALGLKWASASATTDNTATNKNAVRATTTAALAANTATTTTLTANSNGAIAAVDGVTLVANDRLLVKNEGTPANQGIYAVTQVGDASHPYILTRTADATDSLTLKPASSVWISEGTLNGHTYWELQTPGPITVGTTALTFGQLSGGGGGATIGTGTDAAKPSPGTSGDAYLPSDSYKLYRSTGSAQVGWGPLFQFTDPLLITWTWANQGTATVVESKQSAFLTAAAATGDNFKLRYHAVPATPYVIDVAMIPLEVAVTQNGCGPAWYDGTKLSIAQLGFDTGSASAVGLNLAHWNNLTGSFNSSSGGVDFGRAHMLGGGPVTWIRLTDDGTNRTVSFGWDGQNFRQINSVAHTFFLTPTQVGFACSSGSATFPASVLILSWREH